MALYSITMMAEGSGAFFEPTKILGFTLCSLATNSGILTIENSLESESWSQALERFHTDLSPILNAISAHQLSAISAYGVSTTVARPDQHIAIAILLEQLPGLGLTPSEPDGITEIERLASSGDISLWFFRQASLALNIETQALYLLQAAEAAAGQSMEQNHWQTDTTSLRQIMGDSSYEFFYAYDDEGKSVRNMLMHGDKVDPESINTQSALLVFMLKKHYQKKYSLEHMAPEQGFGSLLGYRDVPPLLLKYGDNLPDPIALIESYKSGQLTASSDPKILEANDAKKALSEF